MKVWALKRSAAGLSIVAFCFLLVLAFLTYTFYPRPLCTDGRQNGNEQGIDCGGSCTQICLGAPVTPVLLWSRFFFSRQGTYDVGALIENTNVRAGTRRLTYTFKLYDESDVLLDRRDGSTYLYPKEKTFVFEPGLSSSLKKPARVTFEVTGLDWEVMQEKNPLQIDVTKRQFIRGDLPSVEATLTNRSLFDEGEIEVAVLLKQANDNVYAASKTIISGIAEGKQRDIAFTWPNATFESPAKIELLYRRVLR